MRRGAPAEVGFEGCERVSPRARACTPLMAPSGYSRRTLSYLLFSAGSPEEARGKGEESAGGRESGVSGWLEAGSKGGRRGGGDCRGTRIYPANIARIAVSGTTLNAKPRRPREINVDARSLTRASEGASRRNVGHATLSSVPSRSLLNVRQ